MYIVHTIVVEICVHECVWRYVFNDMSNPFFPFVYSHKLPVEMTSNSASNISTTNLTCASLYFDSDINEFAATCHLYLFSSHFVRSLSRARTHTVESALASIVCLFAGTHRAIAAACSVCTYSNMNYYGYSIRRSMPNAIVGYSWYLKLRQWVSPSQYELQTYSEINSQRKTVHTG